MNYREIFFVKLNFDCGVYKHLLFKINNLLKLQCAGALFKISTQSHKIERDFPLQNIFMILNNKALVNLKILLIRNPANF